MSEMSSTLRKLIKRSDSGDFIASSQLVTAFAEGQGVDKDIVKSEHYKSVFASQLEGYQFGISSLKLINFKGFDLLDMTFSKNGKTTVLVGNNGSGKSTVLDAIQKSLTHISSRLTTRSYNGDPIEDMEIKNEADFATIVTSFYINDVTFTSELSQSRPLIDIKKKSKFTGINEIGHLLRMANSVESNFCFPILASYNVERANDVTTKDIEESEEVLDSHEWNKAKAYSKSLTGRADFKLFFRWFKDQVEQENEGRSDIQQLKAQIRSKEEELNNPLLQALLNETNQSEASKALMDNYVKELSKLKQALDKLINIDNKALETVRQAIYKFLPGFSDLRLKRNPLDMTIKKGGETLSVLQLSQGEKSLLALVADIARRLTLLNPNAENPLNGTGLVLIDEIDLHLHPSWQQKIIKGLENTFENLQFIITTHSPQVCHTTDSENIWLLKDSKKYRAPSGIRGAVSSWVLKNLFDVSERPQEDSMVKKLNRYEELVHNDQYHEQEAKDLRAQLKGHFGASYDVLVQLDLYIENREWEKEFEADK